MRAVAASVLSAAAVLLAYAYGGTVAAFGVGVALFVAAATTVRKGLATHSPMGWLDAQLGATAAPAPGRATEGDSSAVTQRRDPRQESTQLVRLEADILAGLRKPRIYHASLRPQLFDLATALLVQQNRGDPLSLRAAIGEDLWPLLDPDSPGMGDVTVDVHQLTQLLTRMEGFA